MLRAASLKGCEIGHQFFDARRRAQRLQFASVSAAVAYDADYRSLLASNQVRVVAEFLDALDHVIDLRLGRVPEHIDDHLLVP